MKQPYAVAKDGKVKNIKLGAKPVAMVSDIIT